MTPDRWRRVEAIFDEAAAMARPERAAFLDRACGGDAGLRAEVESLLAADADADAFLAEPAMGAGSLAGTRLGDYRLEEKIGDGGMSTVYRAVRADDAYEQKVAVKVVRLGGEFAGLQKRFRAERQILASLDHPGIARLLDGGTTADGRPYLVMEHIEGQPLDRYCDERRLGIDARIDLFRQVCAAVQYAHQNLVVHRDLKPSNILVTGDGVPRLLDFGIAKLLESGPDDAFPTLTGQRMMTPQYASPEQVQGGPITTATDVYSLGVVLYQLLTGRLPYPLAATTAGALERAVVEQEPPRPSVHADRPPLRRKLQGDLDNIVLMALRKEPQRRYATVGLLAEDLRRHREKLPVMARPATVAYRTRRFVERHKVGVAAASLALAVILGLAGTMTVQAIRLARQRDEIRAERDKAQKIAHFVEQVFAGSDPGETRGEEMTARELLDKGAARTLAELQDQPETQSALALVIGRVYERLGLTDRARPLLEQSLATRRALRGEGHVDVAESLLALATLDQSHGAFGAAEARQREAIPILRQALGPQHVRVGDALQDLSSTLIALARYPEAESAVREALAIHRAAQGDSGAAVAADLSNLGSVLRKMGRLPEAEAAHRDALAIGRKVFGPVHPLLNRQINNLAVVLNDQGSYAEGETLAREALAVTRKLYGDRHPDVALQLSNLAAILHGRGDYPAAIATAREALEMRRALFGPENPQVAMSLGSLGDALEKSGDRAAARPLFEEALRIERKVLGPEHPRCAAELNRLAEIALAEGNLGTAEAQAREGLRIREKALGPNHPDVGSSLVTLGSIRLAAGHRAEAEETIRRGIALLAAALPKGHRRVAEAEKRLSGAVASR